MSLESTLTIAGLFLHPLKSGASLAVHQATVSDTGLQYDREWMVVDADGEFVSQRELPRMVQIKPELRHSELVLRAPACCPCTCGSTALKVNCRCGCGTTPCKPSTWATWRPSGAETFWVSRGCGWPP